MAYNAVNIGGIIHGNVNADVFLSIYSESIYCRNIGDNFVAYSFYGIVVESPALYFIFYKFFKIDT